MKLHKLHSGKIREIYEIDDQRLLIVTTDRVSAFDSVLPDTIPGKGSILNQLTIFWMEKFRRLMPNHLISSKVEDMKDFADDEDELHWLDGRAVIAKRLKALPVEAIVRGYLIGSGFKDYQNTGELAGIKVPSGMQLAQKLPFVYYTPSTKAAAGEHDENITFQDTVNLIGPTHASLIKNFCLAVFGQASGHAQSKGVIIADTKFEFGVDENDKVHLIDEVLTPDSSRFWDMEEYEVGTSPPSFDKQIIRDYLKDNDLDEKDPNLKLPTEIIDRTAIRYLEVMYRLMGKHEDD